MIELENRPTSSSADECALESLLAGRDLAFAIQRIGPIAPGTAGGPWHELLLRPKGAEAGDVVRLAEQTGTAQELDLVIAAHGLRALAAGTARVSLNVSAQSVSERGFLARFARVVECAGFPYERLVVEITETAPLSNQRAAVAFVDWLRANGSWIALDDAIDTNFTLPLELLDVVKVDRSLVLPSPGCPVHREQLQAIADAAGRAGIISVAEGVERPEHFDIVTAAGYTHFQGFLFDRPQPLNLVATETCREAMRG